jgi:putative hydrolase of the HAD superfamily
MIIDTVIFDLDQTLLDKNQSLINFSISQFERFKLDRLIPDREKFLEQFIELNNQIIPKTSVYEILAEQFTLDKQLYNELLNDLDLNFPKYCVGFQGLKEMLDILIVQGYKLGVITNGRGFYQRNKIESMGISSYFEDIVISGSVNLRKPDHKIFHLSLNNLNSSVNTSVFVGDNLKADIIPAKEIGMFTILKGNGEKHLFSDAITNDLTEIPEIVNEFNIKLKENLIKSAKLGMGNCLPSLLS